ncbi:MAG: ABC-F family ATP-binding cassette domain-containing protein [Turicibacter sp.]|nr:ABC-F family ATP-binding cassette domain-containing protein [Turicibacter sp.]
MDEILTDVSFILEEREKAALVGVNGAGKTSVFRMLTGEWQPDSGSIMRSSDLEIGYLPQIAELTGNLTLYEELDSSLLHIHDMERELRRLELKMADDSLDSKTTTLQHYAKLLEEFEAKNGYEASSRVKGVLKGLGFPETMWTQPVTSLSGGQRTRVALGKLLLTAPDLLLLDEPTNHLDLESMLWLENYLKDYKSAVLIISHDRYFLDRVTTKTIEIENKKSAVYNGNYSFYAKHKAINRENALRIYLNQQKDIKRQQSIIRAYRARATEKNYIRAKSREKLLDKMEKVDKPESLPDQMRLILTPKFESGNDVLEVHNLQMSFGTKTIFQNACFELKKGEKAALIGPNGVGKTTLLKILMGKYQQSGHIKKGVNLRIGYYEQELQNHNPNNQIFEEIADTYPHLKNQNIRDVLATFLFTGDDVFKPISKLSGGELGRLSLAKIMLDGSNFLILDEPTNHLDLFSKEVLEQALCNFTGTILYVSHDRYFINRTATKILEMSSEGIVEFLGNYDYYLEKKAETQQKSEFEQEAGDTKNGYQAKREQERISRKEETRLKRLKNDITNLEEAIAELDKKLQLDEIARNATEAANIFTKKTELEDQLITLYAALD